MLERQIYICLKFIYLYTVLKLCLWNFFIEIVRFYRQFKRSQTLPIIISNSNQECQHAFSITNVSAVKPATVHNVCSVLLQRSLYNSNPLHSLQWPKAILSLLLCTNFILLSPTFPSGFFLFCYIWLSDVCSTVMYVYTFVLYVFK